MKISWQAQHFVKLEVQISWQAQYKIRFREIADARNAAFFNRKGGSDAGETVSGHGRIIFGSWAESSLHCD